VSAFHLHHYFILRKSSQFLSKSLIIQRIQFRSQNSMIPTLFSKTRRSPVSLTPRVAFCYTPLAGSSHLPCLACILTLAPFTPLYEVIPFCPLLRCSRPRRDLSISAALNRRDFLTVRAGGLWIVGCNTASGEDAGQFMISLVLERMQE